MRTLLVSAHPVGDSLCQHLAAEAETAIRARGWQVERLDLNQSAFNPVMGASERRAYYGDGDLPDDPQLLEASAQLRRAELLILVFPTWWFGFPAVLKGWFDRIWRPGIAFDHSPDMKRLVPRLDGLQHVVAITSMGSPRWVDRLVMHQPLRRVLRRAIVAACAPQARVHWLVLYQAEKVSADRAGRFAAKIRRTLAAIAG